PFIIDVFAEIFDKFWYEMSINGFMLTPYNFDTSRSKITCIRADAGKCFALKRQNKRGSQLESTALQCLVDYLKAIVVLAKAVSRFSLGLLLRIRQKLGFECPTVSLRLIRHLDAL